MAYSFPIKTALNQLLYRSLDEPLQLAGELQFTGLDVSRDELITLARASRQEILQAALEERNSRTALTLAKLEYAPDYTLGYIFDHYICFPVTARRRRSYRTTRFRSIS